MLTVLLLVLLLLILWVLLKPTWLPQAPKNQVTTTIENSANTVRSTLETGTNTVQTTTSGWAKWLESFLPAQRKAQAHQLKLWVANSAIEKRAALYKTLPGEAAEFSAWVAGLSNQDLMAYTNKMAAFCQEVGGHLDMLLSPSAKPEPELKQAVENAVILNSLALWKSREIQALLAYEAWKKAPNAKANQRFAQKVFAKLAEKQVIALNPTIMMESEATRLQFVKDAFETALTDHRELFFTLVREAAKELKAEATPTAKATEAKPAPAPTPVTPTMAAPAAASAD